MDSPSNSISSAEDNTTNAGVVDDLNHPLLSPATSPNPNRLTEGSVESREESTTDENTRSKDDVVQMLAGIAGNILEWYDFAVFGYLSDILGEAFFPPQNGNAATVESFAVFGGAFIMRPVGGLVMGYIGDVYGRKRALVLSIFLMAFPTFAMGCLPTYDMVGPLAIVLLVIVRLLQGLSVGGQLVSSLVFTLENHDEAHWGWYGSFVMAAANFGTLLGGIMGFLLRTCLTHDQLLRWGWRIPFLSGILVSVSGFYLRSHGSQSHRPGPGSESSNLGSIENDSTRGDGSVIAPVQGDAEDSGRYALTDEIQSTQINPLVAAFSRGNLRSLGAASLVPMLWAAGFYLSFVWMAIYMSELSNTHVPHAFGVNAVSLLVSVCLFFPLAGLLSDYYGRRLVMTIGGCTLFVLGPVFVRLIGLGNAYVAVISQSLLGIAVSCWGAPMCAWLVEAFPKESRLTSVAIGYNIAQAVAGGLTPSLATLMVDSVGVNSPGWILTGLSVLSMIGLWVVAPPKSAARTADFQSVPASDAAIGVQA